MAETKMSPNLKAIAKRMGVQFSLRGNMMPLDEAFSDTGGLPGLARRADQLCSLCLGYGLGVTIDKLEGSPLGIKVEFNESTPDTLRYLCIVDVICELQKTSKIPEIVELDDLLYD